MQYRVDNRNLSRQEIKAQKRAEAQVRQELYDKLDIPTKIKLLDEREYGSVKQRAKLAKQADRQRNEKR